MNHYVCKFSLLLLVWCVAATNFASASVVFCISNGKADYCDCGGDCTFHPEQCQCADAQACCADAAPAVSCPEQETHCDCNWDCFNKPEQCQCEEATECCAKAGKAPEPVPEVTADEVPEVTADDAGDAPVISEVNTSGAASKETLLSVGVGAFLVGLIA